LAEFGSYRIRKINTEGIITTIAGGGLTYYDYPYTIPKWDYSGDGGSALDARFGPLTDMAFDPLGSLFVIDKNNARIRKIAPPVAFSDLMGAGDLAFVEEEGIGHILSPTGQHKVTFDLATQVVVREFAYDADNHLISIRDQYGNQTTIERDGLGLATAIVSPDGIRTDLTVDPNSHELRSVAYPDASVYTFEYAANGSMTAEIDPVGNRYDHAFDALGRLTDVSDSELGHWSYSRTLSATGDVFVDVLTGEGNLTTYHEQTDSTGIGTSTLTDPTGGVAQTVRSADNLSVTESLPCGMQIDTRFGIDPEYKYTYEREKTVRTPAGLTNATTLERVYQDTDLDGVNDTITENITENGRLTSFADSTLLSEKSTTSPEGRVVVTQYDPTTLAPTSVSIPGYHDTTFGYDARGRLTTETIGTRVTSYGYDPQGFLASVTDPAGHTTSYAYDIVGRLTGVAWPDGSTVGYVNDANGNVTVLTAPSAAQHGFTYNGVDLRSSYQAPTSGSYSYVYDKDRRLMQTLFPSGAQINNVYTETNLAQIQTPEDIINLTYLCASKLGSLTNGTETLSYGYDGALVTSVALSGTLNTALLYDYNHDFDVTAVTYAGATQAYTYDDDGLLTGVAPFGITRNPQNGLPEAVSGGTLALSRTFNGYGEIDGEQVSVAGIPVSSWGLAFDNVGSITSRVETVDGVAVTYLYSYDPMGRLTTVSIDGSVVEAYQYDVNGTRILETNLLRGIPARSMTYSVEDHLLTAGSATYQYDLDGFLTSKTDGTDTTTYTYSTRGELLTVSLPDGRFIEYLHDPLTRRIAKKVDGVVVEKYLWDDERRLLAVYDGANNLVMRFTYADDRVPNSMAMDSTTYYLTYDQVGSLRLVVDATGTVVKRIDYDAFGNIVNDTNPPFIMPLGFAGGVYDPDTGIIRFGARDYDPDIGRWTAKDPIFFDGGDADLYGYVQNDPVNFVDEDGLSRDEEIEKGAYKFVKYHGDILHGGEHWHVYLRKGGRLLGRLSPSGEVLTGSVPKRAIRLLVRLGKIGGVAFGVFMELALPDEAGGEEAVLFPDTETKLDTVGNSEGCR